MVSVRHTTGRLWRGGQPSIEGRARQSNQKGLEKKGIYIGCIGIETQTKQKGRNTNQNKKERRKEKKIKEKLTERNPIVASKARPGTLTIFKSMSAGVTPTLLAGDVESMTE